MLSPESKRKAVHLIGGIFCLTLPWILPEPWQVDLLALVSIGLLLAIRYFKPALGSLLHSIERLSFGELLFPVGVTIVFRLADGDLSLYLPAIAILVTSLPFTRTLNRLEQAILAYLFSTLVLLT